MPRYRLLVNVSDELLGKLIGEHGDDMDVAGLGEYAVSCEATAIGFICEEVERVDDGPEGGSHHGR